MTGHDGVDHAIGHHRELRDEDRPAEDDDAFGEGGVHQAGWVAAGDRVVAGRKGGHNTQCGSRGIWVKPLCTNGFRLISDYALTIRASSARVDASVSTGTAPPESAGSRRVAIRLPNSTPG